MKETYEALKMEVISFDAEILTIDAVPTASSEIDQEPRPQEPRPA